MLNKTILITGGTGSWGHELVKQLLEKNPKEIRIFSRNEASQVHMDHEFGHDPRLKFIIGDIREYEGLSKATKGVDYVYHLAALKHVPICEHQPYEALKTNVLGTQHVIEASIENEVDKVVYISTDKAANPSNFYGMTKAIGEKLIIYANLSSPKTKFVCVRGGNVLGTNGSVIHVFKHQLRQSNEVRITDKRMTRFFLTLHDAIQLLFKATYESIGGEIFVMKMPTCRIIDLAEVLMEETGYGEAKIVESGIRPGEKLHEILLSEYESETTVCFDEEYFVILPSIGLRDLTNHYQRFKRIDLQNYSSNETLMTTDEIKDMLTKGGFLS